MIQKLNYELLEKLTSSKQALEVTNIDVKRLRDDRSEIQAGQEIAFVATASFRLTSTTTVQELIPDSHIAVGDELLVIGGDAELRSPTLEIDTDSVALWLFDRYTFAFVLNGKPCPAFHDVGEVTLMRGETAREVALPWLRKLQTAMVRDDYFDVDVHVALKPVTTVESPPPGVPPQPDPTPAPAPVIDKAVIAYQDGQRQDGRLALAFHLEGKPPVDALAGKTFRLKLQSDNPEVQLHLVLSVDKH